MYRCYRRATFVGPVAHFHRRLQMVRLRGCACCGLLPERSFASCVGGDCGTGCLTALRASSAATRCGGACAVARRCGSLRAEARLKFPHLIYASVASSAPVRAELDMRGYNDVVAAAYAVSHEGVGGSPACRAAIAEGHRRIGELFGSAEGRATLAGLFGQSAEWYADTGNQRGFAGEGVADFPAQALGLARRSSPVTLRSVCAQSVTPAAWERPRLAL